MKYENPEAFVIWDDDFFTSSSDRWESDIDTDDSNGE